MLVLLQHWHFSVLFPNTLCGRHVGRRADILDAHARISRDRWNMYRPCLHRSPAPLELVLVRFRCDHLPPAVHLEVLFVAQVDQQVEVVLVVVQHLEDRVGACTCPVGPLCHQGYGLCYSVK